MTAYSVDVRVTAPVMDTEIEERVVRAVESLFPACEAVVEDGRVVAEGHGVTEFAACLREQRILDTARAALLDARAGDRLVFDLKKQAAFTGKVNFAVGNPAELGDLHVEVTVHEPEPVAFVELLAPETDEEGRPLEDPLFD